MADKVDIKLMNYLEEIKAFVKTTVKGSETVLTNVLGGEIQKVAKRVTALEVRLERTQDVVTELRHDMKEVRGEMKEMESRLSDKIDKVGEKVEANDVRLDHHLASHL